MAEPTLTLPVSLTVGDHTVEVGELILEPGSTVRDALGALFRRAAETCESRQEGGDDGTP